MFKSKSSSKVRKADHAGSWYSNKESTLRNELEQWWDAATSKLSQENEVPIKQARAIISPHAGFRYSGPTAAVAFRALDINPSIKNIFVIGPSHHVYLTSASISTCDELETPLGNLHVNRTISDQLKTNPLFTTVPKQDEEAEHSLEMQYPWVKFIIDRVFTGALAAQAPHVVPIMAGNTSPETEQALGAVLAPFLADPANLFVVSSDFAHWGKRFRYTYYLLSASAAAGEGKSISSDRAVAAAWPIHESIRHVDHLSMDAISSGEYERFRQNLDETGNTVCGRHPIGIVMCALAALEEKQKGGSFVFTDYTRSGLVSDVEDSSVSYASAYVKVEGH